MIEHNATSGRQGKKARIYRDKNGCGWHLDIPGFGHGIQFSFERILQDWRDFLFKMKWMGDGWARRDV